MADGVGIFDWVYDFVSNLAGLGCGVLEGEVSLFLLIRFLCFINNFLTAWDYGRRDAYLCP